MSHAEVVKIDKYCLGEVEVKMKKNQKNCSALVDAEIKAAIQLLQCYRLQPFVLLNLLTKDASKTT